MFAKGPTFESLLAESFDQIRSNAKGNVAIMSRMLGAFQTLAGLTASPRRRRVLGEQVQWIAELAERSLESAHDRARIDTRLARVREALDAGPVLCTGEGQDYKHGENMSVSAQLELKTSIDKGNSMLKHKLLLPEGIPAGA